MATIIIDDIDDRQDLSSFSHAPLLHRALSLLNEVLLPVYLEVDKAAQRHQKDHRRLTFTSATCGTLAVLFAIIQLVFAESTKGSVMYQCMRFGELLSVILAVISVVLGLVVAKQSSWLGERHKAELLRLLKFKSLIHTTLWSKGLDGIDEWQQSLQRATGEIQGATRISLESWAAHDRSSGFPSPLITCSLSIDERKAIANYFLHKRLMFQSEYFRKRSAQYQKRDHILRRLVPTCFFASVLCALLHSLLDFIFSGQPTAHHTGLWFFLFAASLPVVGWGVRTYRSAHEFARSASLFHAKHLNIEDLRHEVERVVEGDAKTVHHLLCKGEDYLEREHREWLWLMMEAEWY